MASTKGRTYQQLRVNLTGKHFGRLTVIRDTGQSRHESALWLCICDHGNADIPPTKVIVRSHNLRAGKTKSCGCWQKESRVKVGVTHGLCHHPIYFLWQGIKDRCLNSNDDGYHNYGGRGITVCKAWLDFVTFYEWASTHGYQKDLTIERIDVNGNYEPDNCRFATRKEQSMNKRNSWLIPWRGERKHVEEWAEITGINKITIRQRIRRYGWSIDKALTTPPLPVGRHQCKG